MANLSTPTAANIISSLGVKGALARVPSGLSASEFAGFVPMLGSDGKLNLEFMPAGAAQVTVPPLSDVAFVDPYTTVEESLRRGSILAPFKTLGEAAAFFGSSGESVAVVMAAGEYSDPDDRQMFFATSPKNVCLVGLGECVLTGMLSIAGLASSGARVVLQGIVARGNVSLGNCSEATCLGRTVVYGALTLPAGSTLAMSSEAYVHSTNAASVSYLSAASQISNGASVEGDTVEDALDTLESRVVRVCNMVVSDTGMAVGTPPSIDVHAADEVFDLQEHDGKLMDGINRAFAQMANPQVGTLTADRIVVGDVAASRINADSVVLGEQVVHVDADGYLVVGDGAGSSSSSGAPGPGPAGSSSSSSSSPAGSSGSSSSSPAGPSSGSAGSSSSSAISCECVQVDFMDASAGHMVHKQACGDWGETVTFHTDHDGWLSVFRSWDDGGWVVSGRSEDITDVSIICSDGSDSAS